MTKKPRRVRVTTGLRPGPAVVRIDADTVTLEVDTDGTALVDPDHVDTLTRAGVLDTPPAGSGDQPPAGGVTEPGRTPTGSRP